MSKWNKSLFIPEAGQISKNILLAPVPDFVDVPCLLLRWSAVLMCVSVCVCVCCVVRTSATVRWCGPRSTLCRSNWLSQDAPVSRCVRRSSSSVSRPSSNTSTRTRTWPGEWGGGRGGGRILPRPHTSVKVQPLVLLFFHNPLLPSLGKPGGETHLHQSAGHSDYFSGRFSIRTSNLWLL